MQLAILLKPAGAKPGIHPETTIIVPVSGRRLAVRTYWQIAVTFAFAVLLSGCGRESHGSLRKAQIQLINEAADTLVAAKDEATVVWKRALQRCRDSRPIKRAT
jgi:hypothetical protein